MSRFRLNARNVLLTYPRSNLEPRELFEFVNNKFKLEKAVISKEKHMDGEPHIHALLTFKTKVNIKNERVFDFNGRHPSMESVRNYAATLNYVKKDGEFEEFNMPDEEPKEGDNPYEMVKGKEFSREQFLGLCCKKRIPYAYATDAWRSYSEDVDTTIYDGDIPPESRISNAWLKLITIQNLLPNPNPNEATVTGGLSENITSIVIMGETGCGKTTWAKIHAPKPCLFVSHIDQLKLLRKYHKSIIFDDMNFTHIHREAQLHLVDDDKRAIHVRYGTATLQKGLIKIFTCNVPCLSWEDPAIRRRINLIELY